MLAAVAALAAGTVATAHAADTQSAYSTVQSPGSTPSINMAPEAGAENEAASLQALLADWNQAGFGSPSKPAQFRVYGRNGYVTSGPRYYAMVSAIRRAESDAQRGHDGAEASDIARARSLLASAAPAAERG
jgi:hypothetical protein